MKFTAAALALAGTVAAIPAASCPIQPASFEVSNFKFGGASGPVFTERYNFDVKGNVGPSTANCGAATGGGSNKCPLAFRNVEKTQCGSSDFSFSFLGDDVKGFGLQVNFTQPNCGTLIGCRFFPASQIQCVNDPNRPNVRFENLKAPSSFTLQASPGTKCIFQ